MTSLLMCIVVPYLFVHCAVVLVGTCHFCDFWETNVSQKEGFFKFVTSANIERGGMKIGKKWI